MEKNYELEKLGLEIITCSSFISSLFAGSRISISIIVIIGLLSFGLYVLVRNKELEKKNGGTS